MIVVVNGMSTRKMTRMMNKIDCPYCDSEKVVDDGECCDRWKCNDCGRFWYDEGAD
jgi:transposase-like protein